MAWRCIYHVVGKIVPGMPISVKIDVGVVEPVIADETYGDLIGIAIVPLEIGEHILYTADRANFCDCFTKLDGTRIAVVKGGV